VQINTYNEDIYMWREKIYIKKIEREREREREEKNDNVEKFKNLSETHYLF